MSRQFDQRTEHQRGPVLLRRAQIKSGTTDQRLLDSRGPSDWVHTDPWRTVTRYPVELGNDNPGAGLHP